MHFNIYSYFCEIQYDVASAKYLQDIISSAYDRRCAVESLKRDQSVTTVDRLRGVSKSVILILKKAAEDGNMVPTHHTLHI